MNRLTSTSPPGLICPKRRWTTVLSRSRSSTENYPKYAEYPRSAARASSPVGGFGRKPRAHLRHYVHGHVPRFGVDDVPIRLKFGVGDHFPVASSLSSVVMSS